MRRSNGGVTPHALKRGVIGLVTGLGLFLMVQTARAQTCVVSASSVAFGTYDTMAPSASVSTGSVSVTCQALVSVGLSYSIQIGPGNGGSFSARAMSAGPGRLAYQFYTSVTRGTVWGDGTGGTGVVSDSYFLVALANTMKSYTIYGVVPARQIIPPGVYTDAVGVLVVY